MDRTVERKIRDHCFTLLIETSRELGVNYSPIMLLELESAFSAGWRSAMECVSSISDDVLPAATDAAIADGAEE